MQRKTQQQPTVWIDATLLLSCNPTQGTGIERTVVNLFCAIMSRGFTNIRMCRPCAEAGGYVEVDTLSILERFRLAAPDVASPNPGQPSQSPEVRRNATLKQLGRTVLPHLVRAKLRQWHHAWKGVWNSTPSQSSPKSTSTRLELTSSDIVLTLDGGWATPLSALRLEELKKEQGFKSVQIVYDLIPILEPQYMSNIGVFPPENHYQPVLRKSDLILTISQFVKHTIHSYVEQTALGQAPVEVIRLGDNIPECSTSEAPALRSYFDPASPFVLTVCTLEVRKNHYLLYHVWRRLVQKFGPSTPRLLLVGREAPLSDYLLTQIKADLLVRDRIIHLSHCDDRQLGWLYRNCMFTMYPSHHEGWGLPVAESMIYGKHCISSVASSMCEIAPHLVDYHDPIDALHCLRLVEQALDPDFRAAREERIRREYRPTTWDDTARQTIGFIEKHLGPVFQSSRSTVAKVA